MINKATLLGNVGQDPEIKAFSNGDKVANFTLATSERWKDKASGEQKERTEWHSVSVLGQLADIVERYVKKGSKLYIEGAIKTRSWEQDGAKKYKTEIVLQGFGAVLKLLDSRGEAGPSQHEQAKQDGYQPDTGSGGNHIDAVEDEIPFAFILPLATTILSFLSLGGAV